MLTYIYIYIDTNVSKGCNTSSNTTNRKQQYLAFLKCIYPSTAFQVQIVCSQPQRNDRIVPGTGFCVCCVYTGVCVMDSDDGDTNLFKRTLPVNLLLVPISV